jgi:hypothetical protein
MSMSSTGGSYSWVFMVIHTKNKLVNDSLVHAEKAREIETSGVECRLNGHPISRCILYPKPG